MKRRASEAFVLNSNSSCLKLGLMDETVFHLNFNTVRWSVTVIKPGSFQSQRPLVAAAAGGQCPGQRGARGRAMLHQNVLLTLCVNVTLSACF